MKKDFDSILSDCLERILAEGETVDQCLGRYPDEAAELEPLLQVAITTKEALTISPRPEFRERARYEILSVIREIAEKRKHCFSLFNWQPRWAIAVVSVLVLLLACGSTVSAANNSMPDSILYPVKLATEQVRIAITPSSLGKVGLYAQLLDKRVDEIVNMVNKGQSDKVKQVAQRYNRQLVMMTSLVSVSELSPDIESIPSTDTRGIPKSPAQISPAEGEHKVMLAPELPTVTQDSTLEPEDIDNGRGDKNKIKPDQTDKLIAVITNNTIKHSASLQAALENVPVSLKPTVLQAIEASNTEYDKALRGLKKGKR